MEAVLLTGGASRRMGRDKATLLVEGTPQAERLLAALKSIGQPVTVLGRQALEGAAFLSDEEEFGGPLSALARFVPSEERVFVLSCDLPLFDPRTVEGLRSHLGDADAAVPILDGWRQPLCALYRARSFSRLPGLLAEGRRSLMAWLDRIDVVEVEPAKLGVDPICLRSANTPEELESLLARSRRP
jgi:molybdopterin-guanine dinucleotide biosynthesis protein A